LEAKAVHGGIQRNVPTESWFVFKRNTPGKCELKVVFNIIMEFVVHAIMPWGHIITLLCKVDYITDCWCSVVEEGE
jgi:hypothetical protein